jgi:hypothetical protein
MTTKKAGAVGRVVARAYVVRCDCPLYGAPHWWRGDLLQAWTTDKNRAVEFASVAESRAAVPRTSDGKVYRRGRRSKAAS